MSTLSSSQRSQTNRFATFRLDNLLFGINAGEVQEFLMAQRLTRVPLASAAVSGLINLRGQIVTAVDLRHQLGLPPRSDAEPPFNIVISGGEGDARSLQVDSVGDVVELEPNAEEAPPASLSPELKKILSSVCNLNDQLLLILDPRKILQPQIASNSH